MIEENEEINLETAHLEEVIESPPPTQPVVVIHYRSRGIPWYLVLPVVVLVPLGSLAMYYRGTARARRALPPPVVSRPAAASQVEATPVETALVVSTAGNPGASKPTDGGMPLALNSLPRSADFLSLDTPGTGLPAALASAGKPAGSPAAALESAVNPGTAASSSSLPATAGPAPAAEPGKTELVAATTSRPAARPAVTVGFSIPASDASPFDELPVSRAPLTGIAESAEAVAGSEPAGGEMTPDLRQEPTREELIRDIQAEAAGKKAELSQLRSIKDHAREALDAQAQARVEDERAAFHRELREAIRLGGRSASLEIESLCNRYGRNYSDDLRSKAKYLLSHFGGKMTREGKVRLLRRYGIPEAGILDFIANEIHYHTVNSRNGPRDSSEVRVDAARQLLNIKLVKDNAVASKALPAQRVRPSGSTAAAMPPGLNRAR